jgi:small GTP-binding protein
MGKFNGDAYVFKILLVGDSTVGKSSLMEKYITNYFPYEPSSTIGIDYATKNVEYMDKQIKLNIWDTAGQERFKSITTAYYRGSDCIILCYDITNRETFDKLNGWLELVKEHASTNVIIYVVGTKLDLELKHRVVGKDEGFIYAKKHGSVHCELSAKTHNYDTMDDILFNDIVKALYTRDQLIIEKHNNDTEPITLNRSYKDKFNCCAIG